MSRKKISVLLLSLTVGVLVSFAIFYTSIALDTRYTMLLEYRSCGGSLVPIEESWKTWFVHAISIIPGLAAMIKVQDHWNICSMR